MECIHQAKETTAVRLGSLLDAGKSALVILAAGDTRLMVHRAVLVARSPVFAAVFNRDTLEALSGLVIIPDVDGLVLRELVSYLYTLQAPQLPGMAPQLLAAADRYGVSGLKAACEQQLAEQLSVETAAATAVLAVRHCCDSLLQAAISFIKANLQVMATRGWADAVRRQPEDMVEVSRLVSDPPAKTSTSAPKDSGISPHAATQPHSGEHSDCSRTPSSAGLAMAAHHHEAIVSLLRSLSAAEKGRRLNEVAKEGAVGELEALLAAGADVEATDGDTWTALHWAASQGHVEAVRRLVAKGAPLESRDRCQRTPLYYAAMCGHADVVRLLLASHADHSARESSRWTPLHFAAATGKAGAAAALLEAGADMAARTESGETPLDIAKQFDKQQLVDLLTRTSQ